jgi:hypothetical protein
MPAEMLDFGGNADILVFVKEIIKKGDFSRLGQTGSMIIFIERAGETAAMPPVAFLSRSSKSGP